MQAADQLIAEYVQFLNAQTGLCGMSVDTHRHKFASKLVQGFMNRIDGDELRIVAIAKVTFTVVPETESTGFAVYRWRCDG